MLGTRQPAKRNREKCRKLRRENGTKRRKRVYCQRESVQLKASVKSNDCGAINLSIPLLESSSRFPRTRYRVARSSIELFRLRTLIIESSSLVHSIHEMNLSPFEQLGDREAKGCQMCNAEFKCCDWGMNRIELY